MNLRRYTLVVAVLYGLAASQAAADGPIADLKWTYSTDGGKTFAAKAATSSGPVTATATFTVADPSAVAGIFVTLPGKSGAMTRGKKSEWKCPVLMGTTIAVNGKPAALMPSGWIVYDTVPLDPAALVKGANTVTVSGTCALTGWSGHKTDHHTEPIAMVLEAFGAKELVLQAGPVIGAIGEDFFTVCCRTNGAGATVTLTARTDSGKDITLTGTPGLFHRFRAEVPKGTRSVTYSIKASVGGKATPATAGPFTVKFPDFASGKLRFAAVGDTDGGGWKGVSEKVRAQNVDFLVHAGGMNYFPFLHGCWTGIFENAAALHATVPTYAARGFRDWGSFEFDNLFYRPTADGKGENWTQVIGSVRLIGLGIEGWSAGSANVKWLEDTLKGAREKFVFVVIHAAAYSSDESCRPPLSGPALQSRTVVAPLLGKYKVTAMISANSHGYERSEPTPDKGVTQLVAGACGGTTRPRPSGRANRNNGFLKVYKGTTHFLLLEVAGDTCTLQALTPAGAVLDTKTFKARK